jgi:hypothetical protein
VPQLLNLMAAIAAVFVSFTLYSVRWAYVRDFVVLLGLPLLLVLSALAACGRRRAAGSARGDTRDVAASLALGLMAVSIGGGYLGDSLRAKNDDAPWGARCGLVLPEQVWRLAKATAPVAVPLALLCLAGPAGWRLCKSVLLVITRARIGRGARAVSWFAATRFALTATYLAVGALLLPATCVQLASECMRGIGAAAFVLWPAMCAVCWTAGEWALGRRAHGARLLRVASSVALALCVVGSTLTARAEDAVTYDVIACESPLGLGSWHLLGLETLRNIYLAFAVLGVLALDPATNAEPPRASRETSLQQP